MIRIVPATAVALVLTGAAAAPFQVENPPLGYTGGFDEPSCLQCHIGNEVNAYGGTVRIEGLPTRYEPGRAYRLTVRLEAEETDVAGFQLAARFVGGPAEGASAGILRSLDERTVTSDSLGVTYAHHSTAGSVPPDRSGASWTLAWDAPAEGDPVAVHVAANSGNGDQSPLGDLVYVHEVLLEAESRAGR